MSMHMGDGGDPSIAHLPLSDPRCNNDSCVAFEAAHNASQAQVSYTWQYEYGHWTTWYYLIVIFLFMLPHVYHLFQDRRSPPPALQPPSVMSKTVAAWRTISYRRYSGRIADALGMPSIGLQVFLFGAIVFATVATFAVRPYYRGHRGYGSPPLAIRTGLMAVALTPIIVALSGKVNIVTLLTGICYEKLNVIHRWLSYICFALSVVHTFPFIVAPMKDGGSRALHKQYYKPGAFEYTGTPPLAILFFLVTFSIPYVRARAYELFVHSHVVAAIVYLGLMFWHAGNEGDSWVYLWATSAILLFSFLGRVFYKNSAFSIGRPWLDGFPLTVHDLSGDMVKVQIFVPSTYIWRPGQHCFLRIPTLSILDNHPFTIASAPNNNTNINFTSEKRMEVNTLSFLVRPHEGFTRKLSAYARANTDISLHAFVDGPYGGLTRKIENAYDSIILVAGGGGITASVSWLLYLAMRMKASDVLVKQVKLVWVVRKENHLHWVREELDTAQATAPQGAVTFEFYVTDDINHSTSEHRDRDGAVQGTTHEGSSDSKLTVEESHPASLAIVHRGRPFLGERIMQALHAPRTCVLGCGPESMKIDLSNAVARAQQRVWKSDLREVALHTETFGW